jgi:hypothetical protein
MKKYKLTKERLEFDDVTLYRIQALRDFGNVKKGDLGGWVDCEENLSHKGLCWIGDEAQVYDTAKVLEDAQVFEKACIWDSAQVSGNAKIYGEACLCGDALVYGNAQVGGGYRVTQRARIYGNTKLEGEGRVGGDSSLCYCGPEVTQWTAEDVMAWMVFFGRTLNWNLPATKVIRKTLDKFLAKPH